MEKPLGEKQDFLDVSGLLGPRSVAVIGASDRSGNLGGDTVRRLVKFGFPGPVWPVNRSAEPVAGQPAFASVAELPGVPDLVVFAIPASGLHDGIRDCAAAGVRNGIAYAGGLAEAGGEGAELQRSLVALCRDTGFALCGPNCVGIINTAVPVTATFATALTEMDSLRRGAISMVSQSGGIGTNALAIAEAAGFGFRVLVSSGNEAVVSFADYLHAFAQDDGTRVIAAYLEGVPEGGKLVRALEEARRRRKPVVLIKAGATGASARAAQAHTGALVGEDRVFDAVLQEMGVIRVGSVEEMLDVALMLVGTPQEKMPAGPGVGIVTFGGGNGVLAADQAARHGLVTPPLRPDCVERLRPLLVSVATAANPLDLTPTTAFRAESLAQLPDALDALADEPQIDATLFIVGSLAARAREISDVIAGFWRRSTKPVCVCWPSPPRGAVSGLAEQGIHTFLEPARGLHALSRLVTYGAALARAPRPAARSLPPFDWPAFVPESAPAVIPEHRCHAILRAAGLPAAASELAGDEDAAVRAAEAVGLPVVLKGISPAVTHRAAAGLVAVDLRSADEVREAFLRLQARAGEVGVALDGVLVQAMHRGGVELLVSAFRDPLFGTMVSVGAGGGLTELIDDVATERAPVDRDRAAAMLERLRITRRAVDGRASLARDAPAEFIARFSELAATAPWDRFVFEVNPIKWTREGVVAVDGLLILEATSSPD